MIRKGATIAILAVAVVALPLAARMPPTPLPSWLAKLIAVQPRKSGTVIEEASYRGRRVFEIMPSDRAPDSGNEHVLRAEDGRIICEFGGIAGHVTVGSCDIEQIKFVRTLFSRHER
jgi:hypothetical protein